MKKTAQQLERSAIETATALKYILQELNGIDPVIASKVYEGILQYF